MLPLKRRLLAALSKDLIVDLMDMASARTLRAHELVRDNTDLRGRSARALEGQARFRLMEKGFQDVCEEHGAILVEGGVIPGTDLRFFQPFMRFGGKKGVILGFASMPYRREVPAENQSRIAGVSLNYHLVPHLDLDDHNPKPGDIFVLLLVSRDPSRAGQIEEIAIGVINSEYKSYIFYESAEKFLEGYAKPVPPSGLKDKGKLVRLKSDRKPFTPPEQVEEDQKKDNG
jgi:hypothetical protein